MQSNRTKRSAAMNLVECPKILFKETCGFIPCKTKTFIPKGGVTYPISIIFTNNMPSQIPLKPRSISTGKTIGKVINIISIGPKNIPNGIYMSKTIPSVYIPGESTLITDSVRVAGILAIDKNMVKREAPTMIINIILVVTEVSIRDSTSFFGSLIKIGKAKMNAPKAPTAADSVGVAIPVYIPPRTIIIKEINPHSPFIELIFSLKLVFGPLGANFGLIIAEK